MADDTLLTVDKFIADNMLTEDDIGISDLELDPYVWNDLSCDSLASPINGQSDITLYDINSISSPFSVNEYSGFTPPDTPPSSDRSTPPNLIEIHNLSVNLSPDPKFETNKTNVTRVPIAFSHSPIVPNVTSSFPLQYTNTFSNASVIQINNSCNNREHLSQLKREARKLRNRQASIESRKRKQQFLDEITSRVSVLTKENGDIKKENERLKCKVKDLEIENEILKKGLSTGNCKSFVETQLNSNKKATLSLLAVIFMLGLNLAPFSGILVTQNKGINEDIPIKTGTGRSLLWNKNDKLSAIDLDADTQIHLSDKVFNSSKLLGTNCKTFINQSESLRLESELRGWVLRVEMKKEEEKLKKKMTKKSLLLKGRYNNAIPLPRLKSWIQQQELNNGNNGIELYNRQITYDDLLSAIHRRDDTFYFVSFSAGDHLLLPAMSNNGSFIRPRFSIIMPSMNTINESSPNNITYNIAMMQIDCEVINAKIVNVKNLLPDPKSQNNGVRRMVQRSNRKRVSHDTMNRNATKRVNV